MKSFGRKVAGWSLVLFAITCAVVAATGVAETPARHLYPIT